MMYSMHLLGGYCRGVGIWAKCLQQKGDNKEIRVGPVSLQKRLNAAIFWVQSPKCSLEGCFVNLQRGTTNGLRLGPASHPPGQKTPSVMERRLFYYFKQSQPFVENFEKCQEKSR